MGHIRLRGKDTWELKWYEDKRPRTATFHGTKTGAKQKLASLEAERHRPPGAVFVFDFLVEWLSTYAAPRLRQNTITGYRQKLNMTKKNWATLPLDQLTPKHIETLYAELLTAGKSPQTVKHLHRVLAQALDTAVRHEVITENPARKVSPPIVPPSPPKEIHHDAVAKIIESASQEWARVALTLALYTGMRRSEVIALQWSDLDLENGKLQVRAGIDNLARKGALVRSLPKNARSLREVALSGTIVARLKAYRAWIDRMAPWWPDGHLVAESPFLFPRVTGEMRHPRDLTEMWKTAVRRSGLKGIRLHDVRHLHGSTLLRLGVEPTVVAQRLGHSPAVLMTVYAHALPGRQVSAADKFDAFLSGKKSGKKVANTESGARKVADQPENKAAISGR